MKYWVFDLDGTLVDSLTVHYQVMERVFSNFHLEFSREHQLEILKLSSNQLDFYFARKFGAANKEEALKIFERLTKESVNSIFPFPHIEEVLRYLKSKNCPLSVWTARDQKASHAILENTGLVNYFSIIVTGDCVQQGKPHPEGLEKIAAFFESSPNEMTMVGDFESDMRGAKNYHCRGIRVQWHNSLEKVDCSLADFQFHDIPSFQAWIESQV